MNKPFFGKENNDIGWKSNKVCFGTKEFPGIKNSWSNCSVFSRNAS